MTIYSEHALAYLAAGWEIRPEKRKQCPASGQQNASGCCVLAEARLSAAKTLAELLSLSVEWRGASQPRALPEPDVNLSIHPAPIIRPLVPGPNVRTVLDCDVLANATSPMLPLCG